MRSSQRPTVIQVLTSGDVAGGQVVAFRLAEELARRGTNVRFASPTHGAFTRRCEEVGPVDIVPGRSLREMAHTAAIAGYLRRVNATLVHTHTPIAATLLWRIAAWLAQVPMIDHVHIANFFGPPGVKRWIARRLDSITAGTPRLYLAVSRATARSLECEGYPKNRIAVAYNAITWPKAARKPTRRNAAPIIGCVGRFSPAKGQADLVSAFAGIRTLHPAAKLLLVGGCTDENRDYLARIRGDANRYGLSDAITFLDDQENIEGLMRQLDVLALPSWHEAFPLVLLEAMSVGVPVVATRVGGVVELVDDGRTGRLVEAGDVVAIAEAVGSLLSDDDERERIATAAYDDVWDRFSPEKTIEPAADLIMQEVNRARGD